MDKQKDAKFANFCNEYDIPHERSLMLNFFNSEIYFLFENQNQVKSFLEYIKRYDNRFNTDDKFLQNLKQMKSAAWIYSKNLHKYQLEWTIKSEFIDDQYFNEKYSMNPVSYSIVNDYVYNEVRKMDFSDYFNNNALKDNFFCCEMRDCQNPYN